MTRTYTITGGYVSRDGKVMVYLRGLAGSFEFKGELIEGAAARVVNGKAVPA